MISVQGLTKEYGAVRALDELSFSVNEGEILGFLGPNGAGKTTAMRILTGYMPPTSGTVSVAGYDVVERSLEARRHIGYLPETVPLYGEMTVYDYLDFCASIRRVGDRRRAIGRVLEACDIGDVSHRLIAKLSKGYRQRVGLAQALVHDPDVLVLDEPTIGLDPRQILSVRELNAYLASPIAYVVAAIYLAVLGGLSGFILYYSREATLRYTLMHGVTMLFLLLVTQVLTMRLLADEQRQGTIELLLTSPVRDWEVVMGKYLAARHPLRWDVTAEQQFSLSEQTHKILDSLSEPVHVTLFFTPGHYYRQQADDLIQEYALRSRNLTYEFIDPDLGPRRAMEFQVGRDGTIVFQRGERREFCFGAQEQDLTSALLKVTSDRAKGVYFATGHQERDIEGWDETGFSQVAEVLRTENYQVSTFNLAVTDTVPSDMDVLVIADPQKPFSGDEIARLRAFIDQGVSVLAMLEPGAEDPLGGLLADYGVSITDDLVIDLAQSFFGDIAAPLVDRYAFHQITKDLTGLTSFFPTARSVSPVEPAPEGWTARLLASSSPSSWAETRYLEQQVAQDSDEVGGPIGLVAAVEPTTPEGGKGRLVIVGDADFASDGVLTAVRGNIGNLDLFMNAVGWLAEEDALISIRPKEPEMREVVLTPPQARAIIYSNVLFVPLIVLAAGGLVWWRRR